MKKFILSSIFVFLISFSSLSADCVFYDLEPGEGGNNSDERICVFRCPESGSGNLMLIPCDSQLMQVVDTVN